MRPRWAVVGVPETSAHGGDLRARHIFGELTHRTNALSFYRPDMTMLLRAVHRPMSLIPGVSIAAAELLPQATLGVAAKLTHLRVLDLHDHPVFQADAIGFPMSPEERRRQERLTASNLGAFERIVVVSESFADLAGVPERQRLAISNGTDTRAIAPGPWPSQPTVGFISGAAPGRGIELLIEAVRILRVDAPETRLKLGLAATGEASARYLVELQRNVGRNPWVDIETVGYDRLGPYLADTTVLVIPHPPHPYIDSALPVKLFDSLAAGRPLVVTPRIETARVVRDANAGLVAPSDEPAAMAAALLEVLENPALAHRLGENARLAAETKYDWRILASRLADEIL